MSAPFVEPHSVKCTKVIHHTRNVKASPLEVAADDITGDITRDKIDSSVIARASNDINLYKVLMTGSFGDHFVNLAFYGQRHRHHRLIRGQHVQSFYSLGFEDYTCP